jgi:hypothetical protein
MESNKPLCSGREGNERAVGVKFAREYGEIVEDLTAALVQMGDVYECFEMSPEDWILLEEDEQRACIQTLADDVFYALGADPVMQVGSGMVAYDRDHHVIKLEVSEKRVQLVYLV